MPTPNPLTPRPRSEGTGSANAPTSPDDPLGRRVSGNSHSRCVSGRPNDEALEGAHRDSLQVSFSHELVASLRRAQPEVRVCFAVPPQPTGPGARSPLIPYDVLSPLTRQQIGEPSFEQRAEEMDDPSSATMLIYPKKIDDLRRFRLLFVGLLLFVVSSTQGVHSLFGTILMQTVYGYSVKQMVAVYVCGSAFGMFVLPFGAMYDWFGPRVVIIITTLLTALGELLFALMFGGHINHTVVNSCLFYAIMSWGCYGLDVVTLPTVLTHMPRNRGQPTGLLKTFSGLGSTLLSCMFRGFFNNHYDHLLWLMLAFTLVFGAIGAWYLQDAPYVMDRWRQRKLTPKRVLRNYLIRNRYMSQLIPRRRYSLVIIVMVLLNFYLTIQAVVVAYKRDDMTKGKYRGVAIGALVVTALLLILVVPIRAIDGLSPQDKEVIDNAKRKEEELAARRDERKAKAWRDHQHHFGSSDSLNAHSEANAETPAPSVRDPGGDRDADKVVGTGNLVTVPSPVNVAEPGVVGRNGKRKPSHEPMLYEDNDEEAEVRMDHAAGRDRDGQLASGSPYAPNSDLSTSARNRNNNGTSQMYPENELSATHRPRMNMSLGASRIRSHEPMTPSRPVVEVHLEEEEDDDSDESSSASTHGTSGAERQDAENAGVLGDSHNGQTPRLSASFAYAPQRPRTVSQLKKRQIRMEVNARDPSTYNHPVVETINICGEVFVTPVYQTTFFESLTYFDLWLIFYTTMVVWGVGLTMTANWNIQVMVQARWKDMDYKMYILFAAMSGVSTAGGRVFVGVYEQLLEVMRDKCGINIVPTFGYPLASIGLLIAMILWIALPGDKVLITAYIVGPAFYGVSTSFTPYVLGTIYDRDMGMHYGFIFLGAAIGQVFFFYLSWFLTYDEAAVLIPTLGKRCIGQRKCMNKAIGIYVAVVFSSVFTSLIVHMRYTRLVEGRMRHRRVIKYAVRRMRGDPEESDGDENHPTTEGQKQEEARPDSTPIPDAATARGVAPTVARRNSANSESGALSIDSTSTEERPARCNPPDSATDGDDLTLPPTTLTKPPTQSESQQARQLTKSLEEEEL